MKESLKTCPLTIADLLAIIDDLRQRGDVCLDTPLASDTALFKSVSVQNGRVVFASQ
ncbi:MAG: hypothetical protein OWQ57_08490 [Sulfobacillus sp.]|nr:hypothetical protein [Sulfobacillus sp.]